MTVESNYAIRIASLSDWLKNLALLFQPTRSKTKTNPTLCARFFAALSKLQFSVDWFNALFVPVVIGRSNHFGIGYLTVI